jgi:NAD(P)H-hydrate epimerase
MELAGLSCAQAVHDSYPISSSSSSSTVLIACGPGNQGGDGLVAARHLFHFGYTPLLYYPKQGSNEFYQSLTKQCQNLCIEEIDGVEGFKKALEKSDIVLDAIFGFSFHGDPRAPFDSVLEELKKTSKKVVSVDIPSGWTVEEGDPQSKFFTPGAAPFPCLVYVFIHMARCSGAATDGG